MRNVVRLLLVACAPVVGLAACPDLSAPAGAQLTCESTDECPTTHRCVASIGRCIPASSPDQAPPELDGEVTVDPPRARRGAAVSVSFRTKEPLFSAPVVRVQGSTSHEAALDEGGSDRAALAWRYTLVVDETAAEGDAEVVIDLVDLVGLTASHRAATLAFDFTPPAVAALAVSDVEGRERSAARRDAVVVLRGQVEEGARVASALVVGADGNALASLDGAGWVDAQGVLSGAVDLGALPLGAAASVTFVLDVVDEAGNAADAGDATTPALLLDDEPPLAPAIDVQGAETGTRDVWVEVSSAGASAVKIDGDVTAVAGGAPGAFFAFDGDEQLQVTLVGRDATPGAQARTVSATFRDDAGNEAGPVSDVILLVEGGVISDPVLLLPSQQTRIKNGDLLGVGGSGQAGATVDRTRLLDGQDPTVVLVDDAALAGAVAIDASGALSGSFVVGGLSPANESVVLEVVLRLGSESSDPAASRSPARSVDVVPPPRPVAAAISLWEESAAPNDPAAVGEAASVWRLLGAAGAAVNATRLFVYGDDALTQRLDLVVAGSPQPWVPVDADGSFGELLLPDNEGAPYFLVTLDEAANASPPLAARVPRIALAVSNDPARFGSDVVICAATDALDDVTPPAVGLGGFATSYVGLDDLGCATGAHAYRITISSQLTTPPVGVPLEEGVDATVVRAVDHDEGAGFLALEGTDALTMTLDFTPPVVDPAGVTLRQNDPGAGDVLEGAPGAIADLAGADDTLGVFPVLVEVVGADGATLIASEELTGASGAFGPLALGDDAWDEVTLLVTDAAGNSSELLLANDISPPAISGLLVAPVNQRDGGEVTVTFDVTDAASGLRAAPEVWLAGGRLVGAASGSLDVDVGARTFALTFAVDAIADAEGAGEIEVRVVDAAGNAALARAPVTLDYTGPVTTLSIPVGSTWNGSLDLAGAASDALTGVAGVELSVEDTAQSLFWDGSGFTSASEVWLAAAGAEAWSYGDDVALVGGSAYRLRIRGADELGNVGAALAVPLAGDLDAPTTTITLAPADPSDDRAPRFEMTCDDVPCTFDCGLDDDGLAPCASGDTFAVGPGPHILDVRATDAAGNAEPVAASHAWTVTSIIGGTLENLLGNGLVVENNGADALSLTADGSFAFPIRVPAGAPYRVTISAFPSSPEQACGIRRSGGTVPASDVGSVEIRCMARIAQLALGEYTTCVRLVDGRVKCWGSNDAGQLGQGDTDVRGDSPDEVGNGLAAIVLGAGRTATHVAAGYQHICAVLDDETMKCWGSSGYGALGLGTDGEAFGQDAIGDAAGEVAASPPIALGAGRRALRASAGESFTCALLDGGDVKCFGSGSQGKLGSGGTANIGQAPTDMGDALDPVDLGAGRFATAIDSHDGYRTCAILDGGDVKCWGWAVNGGLGLGDTNNRGDAAGEMGDNLPIVELGAGRTATKLAMGDWHTCAILDDGTLKCWGQNTDGRLGLGDADNRGDELGEMGDALLPVDLGAGRTAVDVCGGNNHTCAVLDDGAVRCWGSNSGGALGLGVPGTWGDQPGELGDALPAVDVGGLRATAIACGAYHTCALLEDGAARCWGSNSDGRLVSGDAATRGSAGDMGDNLPIVDVGD